MSSALLDLTARLEASLDVPRRAINFIEPADVRSEVAAVFSSARSLLERDASSARGGES